METYTINEQIKADAAACTDSSTQKVLSNALAKATPECSSKMPVVPHLKRRIRRIRHENRSQPPIPTGFDFELPVQYMQTMNGEDFLLEDSTVPGTGKRYLVFATNKNIEILNSYGNWFIDGTFNSCPDNFYQVYTVHCFVDGTTFPCIYALLPDKRQETYNAFWSNLKADIVPPSSIMMDFEMACINSVGDNFPDTEIKGCFFHFSQAIYRKILEFGYAVQYCEDKDFNLAIRLLAALAFAPPLHVEAWYKQILVTCHIPDDIKNYFEDTFVGKEMRNSTRRKSRFDMDMWNVYFRTIDDLPRTNNALEGFHRGIESMLQMSNPDIWKFIEAIQRQQSLQSFSFAQMQLGKKVHTRKEDNFGRIKRIVCSAANYKELDYLKAIAVNLSF